MIGLPEILIALGLTAAFAAAMAAISLRSD